MPGEFPTLGYIVGEWIETYCIIPDGPQRGTPYLLTREMWSHLLHVYRLDPRAAVYPRFPKPRDGFVYHGSQLRRSQKWGKDPFMAVRAVAHALGPVVFAGWDAYGEPVARPVDTPWVQIAGTSEDNTDNTWRPLFRVLSEGPLADTPGLDVGETRIKLPNGDGWIEPVTTNALSRIGNPISFATITEPHLMTERNGGRPMVKAVKRNLDGMGGSWAEGTNAWDPSQDSVAQVTAKARAPGVYLDHRYPDLAPLSPEEFADDDAVMDRIVIKYGDSARVAGGWVDEHSIFAAVRDESTGEAEARRYFLDEVTVGQRDAANAARWDALSRPPDEHDGLLPGEAVCLGFDGSRVLDATALIAVRVRDGRWFRLGIWVPKDYRTPEQVAAKQPGKVPESLVEQAMDDAFGAYTVWHMVADPYRWQTVLDRKAGEWGTNPAGKPIVVELPTNSERRFDEAIVLWEDAFRKGDAEFSHDGSADLRQHALNSALAAGNRKPPREEEDGKRRDYYVRVVKKKAGLLIDGFVAGILGTYARGRAVEEGALVVADPVEPFVFS